MAVRRIRPAEYSCWKKISKGIRLLYCFTRLRKIYDYAKDGGDVRNLVIRLKNAMHFG